MQNPKTIADLSINLHFCKTLKFPTYPEFEKYIKEINKDLEQYNIIPGIYSFIVSIPIDKNESSDSHIYSTTWETVSFDISVVHGTNRNIINFLYKINYNIHQRIKKASFIWTELDRFVLVAKNTFEIEFTLPF